MQREAREDGQLHRIGTEKQWGTSQARAEARTPSLQRAWTR
jgi:hypothetical protein